ncbi:glycosyltransferase [Flavobacterium anhuiense]|uniref:glycosyltransferase n=1 Tax=Flavobacterium anhuiense TaxID=459526 RepID=UPI003D990A47
MDSNLTVKLNPHAQTALLGEEAQQYDMIVFSNIEWQCVYQRPQHILNRMAESMKILYIEEPSYNSKNKKSGHLTIIKEKLHVLKPNVANIETIGEILPLYIKNKHIPIGWFYDPAFCPLLESFQFDTIVYDCMNELSSLKDTDKQVIDQEKYLMANADIVFTNGESLYELKKQAHDNVHYFPSSVNETHFSKALQSISIPADIGDIPSPIAGFYGTIDERIDFNLLKQTADKLPSVSFVMIGPVRIEENELPQASNIHYLGTKCYDELPNYLKAFDIAMLPFAVNETTKYSNPAKTLEYMAARKPIISTKIPDVVRNCNNCINIIETADAFAKEIQLLSENKNLKTLESDYRKILDNTSWDITVNQMKSIIKFFAK